MELKQFLPPVPVELMQFLCHLFKELKQFLYPESVELYQFLITGPSGTKAIFLSVSVEHK